ncbi:MAG: protein kinase, partial [Planctomycetes bacterium]|nr:protein kinase [Planctomycetota bacterium]
MKTSAEFLEVLEKSRLLSESQLQAARQLCEREDDPKGVARTLIRDGSLTKWQALHLLAGRFALSLGKYRFLDQIGADDRQRVYLAEHPQLGRQVAIQTLSRRHVSQNPDAVQQFLEQGRKLASLEHSSILHIYDVDSEGDRCFIVLEHVQGRRLRQIIDEQGPLPVEVVADYTGQVAQGLAYAHERQVAHGDLRPANVVVDDQGNVRIANLGVAGLVSGEEDSSSDDTPTATGDGYAAPERTTAGTSPDSSSDLFALGGLMFAMLTGHDPQPGQSPDALLEERPEVPEPLFKLFQSMTAKDRSERITSAAEVVRILEQHETVAVKSDIVPGPTIRTNEPGASRGVGAASSGESGKQVAPTPPKLKAAKKPSASRSAGATQQPKSRDSISAVVVPGLPEAPVAETPSPGTLAINTKTRRRKKPADARPSGAGSPAAAKAGDVPAQRSGIPKVAYIAGGAAVGVIGLIAMVLLLMFAFSGEDEVTVAQGDVAPETAAASPDSSDNPAPIADAAESDPGLNLQTDPLPEETDPGLPLADASEPAADAVPEPRSAQEPVEASAEATSPAGPPEPPASVDTAERNPDAPPVSPTAVPAESAGATGNTGEEPLVASPPAQEPPAETPKPEPKREAKKAKSEPTASKPKTPDKKAFAEMPAIVSLPSLDSADAMNPKTLGPVYAGSELCFIRMRGGEGALKGSQTFAMRNANGGLAERDWEINLREGSAGSETKIAQLSLNDQSKLVFQWQPAAKNTPAAAHLMNCAFSLTCRGDTHVALLRQPNRVPALDIDLNEPALKQDWSIDAIPDPDKLRVELKGVKGAKCVIEPQPIIKAEKGEAWVKLEDGGGMLSLNVETDLRKDFQITVLPYVRWTPDAKPEKLIVRKLPAAKSMLAGTVQRWAAAVQQGQAIMKSKAPEQQKKQTEQLLRNYENELKASQELL